MNQKLKCVGIDLGTTNSEIYRMENKVPIPIKSPFGIAITPSRIGIDPSKSTKDKPVYISGTRLKNPSSNHPGNVIYEPKRVIGRLFEEPCVQRDRNYWPFQLKEGKEKTPTYSVKVSDGEIDLTAVDVSAEILKLLTSYHKAGVESAVITVPSYFNKRQVEQTMQAGRLAGLKVPCCLPEPVAAAIAYGYKSKITSEKVLVYDLGGGTFDCCIVVIENGHYRILRSDGHSHLGGADFDNEIVEMVAGYIMRDYNFDVYSSKKDLAKLKGIAEDAKKALSYENTHKFNIVVEDTVGTSIKPKYVLARAKFEGMIKPYIDRTIEYIENVLGECTMRPENIDRVLLVGGSTRIPYVRARLEEFFGYPIDINIVNVDEAVAEGAAIYAHSLIVDGIDLCTFENESVFRNRPAYSNDGDRLEGIPFDMYYSVNGGKPNKIMIKGTKLDIEDGKYFRRTRGYTLEPGESDLYVDILIQDEKDGELKAIDCLTMFYDDDDIHNQRKIDLLFDYSKYGRLVATVRDNANNKIAYNTILLRRDALDDNQEYIHRLYSIRKRMECLKSQLGERNDGSDVFVELREELSDAFVKLRDISEYLDEDDIDDFDNTVRGLEEYARNL